MHVVVGLEELIIGHKQEEDHHRCCAREGSEVSWHAPGVTKDAACSQAKQGCDGTHTLSRALASGVPRGGQRRFTKRADVVALVVRHRRGCYRRELRVTPGQRSGNWPLPHLHLPD
jgi:hypothetical protein